MRDDVVGMRAGMSLGWDAVWTCEDLVGEHGDGLTLAREMTDCNAALAAGRGHAARSILDG